MIAIHMNTFTPEVSAIAGVGPGLGASLARKLAKEGSRLALLARSPDFLETLSNELQQYGTEALSHSHRRQRRRSGGGRIRSHS